MEKCNTLFPRENDVHDISGCLKPYAHNDSHICRNNKGELIEWEDDYSCRCGCWDEEDGHPCIIYGVISEDEFREKLKQY